MNFDFSDKVKSLIAQLSEFMDEHIYPNEKTFQEQLAQNRWQPPAIIEELKEKAKSAGLWNLFLPESELGAVQVPVTVKQRRKGIRACWHGLVEGSAQGLRAAKCHWLEGCPSLALRIPHG